MFTCRSKSHIELFVETNTPTILRELTQSKSYKRKHLKNRKNRLLILTILTMLTWKQRTIKTTPGTMVIHLNICGWTQNNKELRTAILKEVNADIFSICETHLKEIDEIEVDGYTWKGFNRQYIHRNASYQSGEKLLIKNWIFEEYKYETIGVTRNGIICGKF
ncbi:unnamed protein product [Mytilus edulis]|uniref:Uncharacterized protein n=1 Tax=Mytilus edulis TaxID=6550 RepID=A0A8S3VB70_MYTED|nr:unnamed protein product [Mytilus edulis]